MPGMKLTQINQLIEATWAEMSEFAMVEWNVDLRNLPVTISVRRIQSECRYITKRETKKITIDGVTFGVKDLMRYDCVGFNEYASFNKYKNISSFKTTSSELYVIALVAHEFAHAVQFSLANIQPTGALRAKYGPFKDGHSNFFKAIYQELRLKFVNHHSDYTRSPVQVKPFISGVSPEIKAISGHEFAGRIINIARKQFEVIGIKKSNPKYPFMLRDVKTGEIKKTNEKTIKIALNMR